MNLINVWLCRPVSYSDGVWDDEKRSIVDLMRDADSFLFAEP